MKIYYLIYNSNTLNDPEPYYDLITEHQFDCKPEEFWEEWQSVADELHLPAFLAACQRKGIPLTGSIEPYNEGSGFNNFRYEVRF